MRDRNSYIGSSDARSIADRALWGQLYRTKKGIDEREDLSGKFVVQLGIHTELFHIGWLEKTNPTWEFDFDETDQHHASINFGEKGSHTPLGSTIDSLLRLPDKNVYGAEVKHVGQQYRDTQQAIDYYMPQLQHHMMCWGHDRILFSAIIGNREPEPTWVGYSQEWCDWYAQECQTFWTHMIEDIPPPENLNSTSPPVELRNTILINGQLVRNLKGNNQAFELVADYNRGKIAETKFKAAGAALKELITPEDSMVFIDDLFTIKRNAKGSPVIYIKDKEYGTDEA